MTQPVRAQSLNSWESLCNPRSDYEEIYPLQFCKIFAPELLFAGYDLISGADSYIKRGSIAFGCGSLYSKVYGKVNAKILLGTEMYAKEFELAVTNAAELSIFYVHRCKLTSQEIDWSFDFDERVGVIEFVAMAIERVYVPVIWERGNVN